MNGPPTVPEAAKATPGETPRAPGAITVSWTERDVFPLPLDVLLNWTVSEKEPAASAFAEALINRVMFAVAFRGQGPRGRGQGEPGLRFGDAPVERRAPRVGEGVEGGGRRERPSDCSRR